jgi:cbb3-type cytochrome oxidase maturation protein
MAKSCGPALAAVQVVGVARPRAVSGMDILYLLIPLSVVLVFCILAGLWWAIDRGQFDELEGEAERILDKP